MYISGRPSHFTAKRNIAITIIILLEFFFTHPYEHPSISSRDRFPPIEPFAITFNQAQPFALIALFPFSFLDCVPWLCRFLSLCLLLLPPASATRRSKRLKKEKHIRFLLFEKINVEKVKKVSRRSSLSPDCNRLATATVLLRVRHRNDEQSYYNYITIISFP